MAKHYLLPISCLVLLAACGQPAKAPDEGGAEGEGEGGGSAVEDVKPKDNIVRDADGDGEPDDADAKCDGMPETRCKINASCAWTDTGTCVNAKN
jgi:hypothetical protein